MIILTKWISTKKSHSRRCRTISKNGPEKVSCRPEKVSCKNIMSCSSKPVPVTYYFFFIKLIYKTIRWRRKRPHVLKKSERGEIEPAACLALTGQSTILTSRGLFPEPGIVHPWSVNCKLVWDPPVSTLDTAAFRRFSKGVAWSKPCPHISSFDLDLRLP